MKNDTIWNLQENMQFPLHHAVIIVLIREDTPIFVFFIPNPEMQSLAFNLQFFM